ncbi:MAG TPA: ABC transporter ATP-binding protein [Thermoplasmata archaeon]|nr:ABC transporter ATP-binding protein [Thermoplasmata archaeon]
MATPLLEIRDLSVDFEVGAGTFHAVNRVSLDLTPGRVVGIVGETGSGKSTLGHAIPRLLPEPPAKIKSGTIKFRGIDILTLPKWQLPMVRGSGIGMIFQEPINSLNPAFRIFDQVAEAIMVRKLREAGKSEVLLPETKPFDYSKGKPVDTADALAHPLSTNLFSLGRSARSEALRKEVLEYLRLVRINDPETILSLYPHELSGGMRQRIMIAIALSAKPSLLIADEPTSALDITIQAQVLTLMKELMTEVRTSILFISHDLGVIAEMADDVGVLYAGHLVEYGPVAEVYGNPRHPYTKMLMRAIPNRYKTDGRLPSLPGSVPSLAHIPPGCAFHTRCPLVQDVCTHDPGPALAVAKGGSTPDHRAACYFSDQVASIA